MRSKESSAIAMTAAMVFGAAAPQAVLADTLQFSFSGWFTQLVGDGAPHANPSLPSKQEQGRTPITGLLSFDTQTGAGSGAIDPFDFNLNNGLGPTGAATFKSITFQTVGDGAGGNGPYVLGNMLFDWGGNSNIPVSVVMDASGMFGALQGGYSIGQIISGVGAIPAADGSYGTRGYLSYGPSPIATTTFNTTAINGCAPGSCLGINPSGGLPLITDTVVNQHLTYLSVLNGGGTVFGIGGSPMLDGPLASQSSGSSFNFDISSMTMFHVDYAVPVPAAVWLLGSGLLGLLGVARRTRG